MSSQPSVTVFPEEKSEKAAGIIRFAFEQPYNCNASDDLVSVA
jgi:hypothetical protein